MQSVQDDQKAWLSLADYSTKYHVSISTLRRRIKNQSIQFCQRDGKYFVLDSAVGILDSQPGNLNNQKMDSGASTHSVDIHHSYQSLTNQLHIQSNAALDLPTQLNTQANQSMVNSDPMGVATMSTRTVTLPNSENPPVHPQTDAPVGLLLEELRKAYRLILQEKEQQVLELKEEIADLRTLVRVLESENQRLSSTMTSDIRSLSIAGLDFEE